MTPERLFLRRVSSLLLVVQVRHPPSRSDAGTRTVINKNVRVRLQAQPWTRQGKGKRPVLMRSSSGIRLNEILLPFGQPRTQHAHSWLLLSTPRGGSCTNDDLPAPASAVPRVWARGPERVQGSRARSCPGASRAVNLWAVQAVGGGTACLFLACPKPKSGMVWGSGRGTRSR